MLNKNGSSTGWTAGLGVDYAVTESVFARIEYRYTSFTTAGFMSVATDSAEPPNHLPINDLRAALAYKFGGHQTQSNLKCSKFVADDFVLASLIA